MKDRSAVERPKYITLCVYISENGSEIRITHLNGQGELCELATQATPPQGPDPDQARLAQPEDDRHMVMIPGRDWYVWRRHGGESAVLPMIADPERCAHCDEGRIDAQTTNGWFCLACQRTLANLGQLPKANATP